MNSRNIDPKAMTRSATRPESGSGSGYSPEKAAGRGKCRCQCRSPNVVHLLDKKPTCSTDSLIRPCSAQGISIGPADGEAATQEFSIGAGRGQA